MDTREPTERPARLAEASEGLMQSWDGTRLFLRWRRSTVAHAAVLFAHGILEHSGRYGDLDRALVASGIDFYAYDHRGHGRSEGPRGGARHFEDLVTDLGAMSEH